MQTSFAFYLVYFCLAVMTILFIPVSTLFGVAIVAAGIVFIPIALVGRNQKMFFSIRENWISSLGCSLVVGIIFTVLFVAKIYLLIIAIGITGSPYNVPEVDYVHLSLSCLATAGAASLCVFFAYDGFKQIKRQIAKIKNNVTCDIADL